MKLQTIIADAERGAEYTVLELSRMLDHHPSTLGRLLRDGHGPKHSMRGKAYVIAARDVISWLDACKPVRIGAGPSSTRNEPRDHVA